MHPAHLCGRIITIMAKNFGQADFAWRFWPKPVTAVLVAGTLVLCLANSPPAFAQVDPFAWFEQLFRPEQPSHVAKPRSESPRSAPREHLARPRPSYPSVERAARRPTERTGGKAIAKTPDKPAVAPSRSKTATNSRTNESYATSGAPTSKQQRALSRRSSAGNMDHPLQRLQPPSAKR